MNFCTASAWGTSGMGSVGTGSVGTGSGDCLSERHSHRLLCTCENSLLLQPHNRRAVLSPISQMRRARPSVVSASPAGHREAQLPGCRVAVGVPGMSQGGDSGGHSGWVMPEVTELAADYLKSSTGGAQGPVYPFLAFFLQRSSSFKVGGPSQGDQEAILSMGPEPPSTLLKPWLWSLP